MNLKLNPSNRINRRYILIESKNKETVEQAILNYVGILGWAKAKPFFVKEKEIILAVERSEINNIRAAFELCKEDIKVLRVSGTLKGLKRKL